VPKGGKRKNAGRKKIADKAIDVTVIFPVQVLEKIRGNRSRFIREAVEEKLKKPPAGTCKPTDGPAEAKGVE
jgi:hypothetical protein